MKSNKICKIFIMIFSFFIFFNVKASTILTYNNSAEVLQNYYNNINKSDFFISSNAGLITINEYNKTLSSSTFGSTFLYNGKIFLFKDASILKKNAEIDTIGPDENTNARLSVLLNRGIKVKGSGTKADPYTFVDTSDIKIISMKKDGVDIKEVPTTGRYDFVSNCIGGSASYSNTTHELNVKITKAPVICSLEFNEIKSAKIVAYIYGANTEINEKDILLGESGSINYTLKSGYSNETPYMYCEKGTSLTYSSTKITVNTVSKDDTCHVAFPKTVAYTSATMTEKAPVQGTYKIEAWGAQGKNYSSSYQGGKGGYIAGKVVLAKDTTLTIKIGKQDGTNGGGIGSSGTYNGGGSTRIINGSTTLLTAAGGGGASLSGSGGAGGSGTGTGGSSTGAGAGVSGASGGGGSSSLLYTFSNYYCYSYYCPYGGFVSGYRCVGNTYDIYSVFTYTYICSNGWWSYAGYYCDGNCNIPCASGYTHSGAGCTNETTKPACTINGNTTKTLVACFASCIWSGNYDAYCSSGGYEYNNYQNPGQGGSSSVGTGVTQLSKTDGNNTGDGKVKITLLSR